MTAPQRIAILADVPHGRFKELEGFPEPTGHYTTWLEALIPEMEDLPELDIHWITMSKAVRGPVIRHALGQTFHILPRYRKLLSMATAYRFETRRILKEIRSIQPDLLHAWGTEDVYGIAAARSGFKPRIFTLQGCVGESVARDPAPHPLLRLQARFEPATIRSYCHATGESPVALSHLRRINPEIQIHQIDYGVSPDFFQAEWCPDDTPNVLFAGSLISPKGVHELVEVFQRPEFLHVILHLAGDGPLYETIEALRLPNLRLLGRLTRPELIAVMERAWCLVIPTHADTGPSVLKEARVVGLPVISTTAAGASSLVTEAGCGFVIPPGDTQQLTESIQNIVNDRDTCLRMGRAGWTDQRSQLHPSHTARIFAELYQEVLSEGKPPRHD